MGRKYRRKQKLPLVDVLSHIGKGKKFQDNRMLLFIKGTRCVCCGLKGEYFWLEKSGCFPYHYNLYGLNEHGHEVMLTQDHILPRSKGGGNNLENLQLLCQNCNKLKGNKILTLDELKKLITNPPRKKSKKPKRLKKKKCKKPYIDVYPTWQKKGIEGLLVKHGLDYTPVYIGWWSR